MNHVRKLCMLIVGLGLVALATPCSAQETRALLIGNEGFISSRLGQLKAVPADLQLVKDTLQGPCGLKPSNITVLHSTLERPVSKAQLLQTLDKFFLEAGPQDALFLYISSHGISYEGDYQILLTETRVRPETLMDTVLRAKQLTKLLEKSKAKTILIALDTCQEFLTSENVKTIASQDNKAMSAQSASSLTKDEASRLLGNPKSSPGVRAILYSCRPSQLSWMDTDGVTGTSNSFFTFALCEGLQGKAAQDGSDITLTNLSEYTTRRLSELIQADRNIKMSKGTTQLPSEQTAYLSCFGGDPKAFVLASGRAASQSPPQMNAALPPQQGYSQAQPGNYQGQPVSMLEANRPQQPAQYQPQMYQPAAQQSYQQPAQTYQPLAQQSYQQPAQTYQPAAQQGYQQPAQTYQPAAQQSYQQPAQTYQPAAQQSYQQPAQTYQPAAQQSYQQPAQTYQPAAQQSYQQPAQTYQPAAQQSYQQPAQTYPPTAQQNAEQTYRQPAQVAYAPIGQSSATQQAASSNGAPGGIVVQQSSGGYLELKPQSEFQLTPEQLPASSKNVARNPESAPDVEPQNFEVSVFVDKGDKSANLRLTVKSLESTPTSDLFVRILASQDGNSWEPLRNWSFRLPTGYRLSRDFVGWNKIFEQSPFMVRFEVLLPNNTILVRDGKFVTVAK